MNVTKFDFLLYLFLDVCLCFVFCVPSFVLWAFVSLFKAFQYFSPVLKPFQLRLPLKKQVEPDTKIRIVGFCLRISQRVGDQKV